MAGCCCGLLSILTCVAEQVALHIGFRNSEAGKLRDVPHVAGERGAMLYESSDALPLVYAEDNLEAARAFLSSFAPAHSPDRAADL